MERTVFLYSPGDSKSPGELTDGEYEPIEHHFDSGVAAGSAPVLNFSGTFEPAGDTRI